MVRSLCCSVYRLKDEMLTMSFAALLSRIFRFVDFTLRWTTSDYGLVLELDMGVCMDEWMGGIG